MCVGSSLEFAVWFVVGLGPFLGVLRLVVEVWRGSRVLLVWVVVHHLKLGLDGPDLCIQALKKITFSVSKFRRNFIKNNKMVEINSECKQNVQYKCSEMQLVASCVSITMFCVISQSS